jgi:hypothetical protein
MRGHYSTRNYQHVARQRIDTMLDELIKNGAKITGNNPWFIDTQQSGVKLRGEWCEATLILSVTLTKKDWYVPSSMLWETIESLMQQICGQPDADKSTACGAHTG